MIVQWNTGAHYTKHGQRIIAEQMPDGQIRFIDRDRGIYGLIAAPAHEVLRPKDTEALKRRVMDAYLHNRYTAHFEYEWALPYLDRD